jgi:beta-glucosidase/6-phospho-beta-glucosidase/beta-galactosidase
VETFPPITSRLLAPAESQEHPMPTFSFETEKEIGFSKKKCLQGNGLDKFGRLFNRTASTWLRITPWGIRRMLNWIKERYNNPDVIITENGMSDRSGFLDDSMRIYF